MESKGNAISKSPTIIISLFLKYNIKSVASIKDSSKHSSSPAVPE
jgi:hypothetical protein